ncbi:MAG TPA: hypothetical protein VK762_16680 [Polyangiaceae bacterium]|jgi:hypothetical protein|nr:hypothetical protein [Polyangiaceae bacterium]
MIGFRGLTALALACAASAMACSSSSSSSTPTKFACADMNPMGMQDQACTSCVTSMCSSEAMTAFGSGVASGDYGGGVCGSYETCNAACGCGDTNCITACGAPSTSCEMALEAGASCADQKCSSVCGSSIVVSDDGGGFMPIGSDAGTGGGTTAACDESAQGFCIEALPSNDCGTVGGTITTSCPSAGLVGCCDSSGVKTCFYPPLTMADAMQACMGTFTTSL